MKAIKFVIICFCALALNACSSEPNNSPENLNAILAKKNIEFDISVYSCFGGDQFSFELENSGNFYTLNAKDVEFSKTLSLDEFEAFKTFLTDQLNAPENSLSLCTRYISIKMGGFFSPVLLENDDCSESWDDFLNSLDINKVMSLTYDEG